MPRPANDDAGAAAVANGDDGRFSYLDPAPAGAPPLFASALVPVDGARDPSTTLRVTEDVVAFAGGAVHRLEWCADGAHLAVEARPRSRPMHYFDELGTEPPERDGVVQVWRFDDGRRRGHRPGDGESVESVGANASAVLGISHSGGDVFDMKWARSPPSEVAALEGADATRHDDAANTLGVLAVALETGAVEAWLVPSPASVSATHRTPPPTISPNVCFRGVLPPSAGVALALDWACTKPKRRLAVATSGGCAYLFTLDGDATPMEPTIRIASTGYPQRSIAWARDPSEPEDPDFEDDGRSGGGTTATTTTTTTAATTAAAAEAAAAEAASEKTKKTKKTKKTPAPEAEEAEPPAKKKRGRPKNVKSSETAEGAAALAAADAETATLKPASLRTVLMMCGHCMTSPVIYDTRDVFSPIVGNREFFSGGTFLLACAWLPRGILVSAADNGAVATHDHFNPELVDVRDGHVPAKQIIEYAWGVDAKKPGGGNKFNHESGGVAGSAWSVDVSAVGDRGIALVAVGTGKVGACVAMVHAGYGNKTIHVRKKTRLRDLGAAIDLTPVGGSRREALAAATKDAAGGGDDDANLDSADAESPSFGQRPGAPAGDAHAVRCVRWRPATDDDDGDETRWLAFGDDGGYLRFQRFDARGMRKTAELLRQTEDY